MNIPPDADWPTLLTLFMEENQIPDQTALGKHLGGYSQSAVSKWMDFERKPREGIPELAEKLRIPLEIVSAAIARTKLIKKSPQAARLRECQERLAEVLAENEKLRSRLASSR